MKATDLRVGNWANNGDKDYLIDHACLIDILEHNRLFPEDEIWRGIPLTEEWFLKVDHKQIGRIYLIHLGDGRILGIGIDGSYGLYHNLGAFRVGNSFSTKKRLKYVHQLQNLYHSLTEEELKIQHHD